MRSRIFHLFVSDRAGRRRWLAGIVIVVGIVLTCWLMRSIHRSSEGPAFPFPPYSESHYLNIGAEARYIGTAACAGCHAEEHRSYLLTAHSRALSDIDPQAEPPDGAFEHPLSGRSYRVYRQDGQMRHEEVLRTREGKEIARVDLPIRYLVGSSHFSRSYLVEVAGFLHESPITWYSTRKKWGLSPGYDLPQHWSFERPANLGCLVCHCGRVETAGATHRLTFHEKAIGCENCHGPGSLHQDLHRAGKLSPDQEDLTIVHPGKLSRPLQEAVCAACHQSGPATVQLRGRRVTDYRPGMPLTDYRIHYRFAGAGEGMTVVGHVEQLRLSACYQKSKDLTCLSCHDPHQRSRPKDPTAYYRQKCLSCHSSQACALDEGQRRRQEPADSCAACHMPRGDTDIPHIAFTHHRIGRHTKGHSADPEGIPDLVAADDDGHLSPLERQRNLGLAHMKVAQNPIYSRYVSAYHERARKILEAVRAAGLHEPETAEALAQTYWKRDPARAAAYAREALAAADAPVEVRALALLTLASCEMRERRYRSAEGLLKELVTLRRCSEDWCFLGISYLGENQPREALPALEKALAIRPDRHLIHVGLAEAYRQLGDNRRSQEHLEKARWLLQHDQQRGQSQKR
jgi:tetratricopeptide (TPR) repeat protein